MIRGAELLATLCGIFGPSGCEDLVAEQIREWALPLADVVTNDRLGSLLVLLRGTETEKSPLLLCTSMDEDGFMLRSIGDNGLLYPARLSMGDGMLFTGRTVRVGNRNHQIDGIVGATPAHKSGGGADFSSLYIDIGAKNKAEAERFVQKGDYGVFQTAFATMGSGGHLWKGKAIDARVGCAVLLEVLADMAETGKRPARDIWFCFTRRGKVGTTSACAAYRIPQVEAAVMLEGAAVYDMPGVEGADRGGTWGNGVLLTHAAHPVPHDRELTEHLRTLAKMHDIPMQDRLSVASNIGIAGTKTGIRTASLALPIRNLHTAVSILHEGDYRAMLQLVEQLVLEG